MNQAAEVQAADFRHGLHAVAHYAAEASHMRRRFDSLEGLHIVAIELGGYHSYLDVVYLRKVPARAEEELRHTEAVEKTLGRIVVVETVRHTAVDVLDSAEHHKMVVGHYHSAAEEQTIRHKQA